jgi:hexosaminidase
VIKPEYDAEKGVMMISLSSELDEPEIYYSLDGSEPDINAIKYDTLFELNASATVKAVIIENEELLGPVSARSINLHKGTGKAITYKDKYSDRYTAGGDQGLLNGLQGSVHYNDGQWQGFRGVDIELVVDMGSVTDIKGISVGFMQNMTTWIFLPANIQFLVSDLDDAASFKQVGEFLTAVPMENKEAMVKNYSRAYNDLKARYVKVIAKNPGPCPDWHPGAGGPSWVFVDEIIIE